MKDKLSIHLLKESNDKIYYYLHSIEDSFQYAHNCLNNEPNEKYKEMAYGTNQMTLLVALVDNSRIIDSKTYTDILQVFKTQFNFFDSDTSKTNPIDFQVIRNIFLSNNEITTKLLVNKLNRYDHISEEKIDKSN